MKYKLSHSLNPLFTLIIIGALISGLIHFGLKGIAFAVVFAVAIGILDGVKIIRK